MSVTADWQIVLTADGAVLAATGGVPASWIGARLEDCPDVPAIVRAAARALLRELHGSVAPMATKTVEWPLSGQTIQLIALEAVPLRRAAVDLRALLESVVGMMRQQAAVADVALTLDVDPAQPATMSLDPEKVAWAVTVLVGNALRYVRRGSRLMPGGLIAIRATFDATASEATISVQDDGIGIPEHKVALLFRRAPDRRVNAGLGLIVVFEIVAAHGGRMDVESRTDAANHGTTIRMTLPVL